MYWDSISYTRRFPLSSIGSIVSSPCLIGREQPFSVFAITAAFYPNTLDAKLGVIMVL
jgi:hypothetical protein